MVNINYKEFDEMVKNRISNIIYNKELSLRKISRELGHCDSYMQKLLSKKSTITLKALIEICNYLEIPPNELIVYGNDISTEYNNISGLLKKQNPEILEKYYNALKCLLE